jgi:hypothetical protein
LLVAAYVMIIVGILALGSHLLLIRPSRPFSRLGIEANALVAVFLLWYLRALVLLAQSDGSGYTGPVTNTMVFRVVSGFVIDALIVARVLSFLRFRIAYRKREKQLAAGDVEGERP